jgi:hypothetical protein
MWRGTTLAPGTSAPAPATVESGVVILPVLTVNDRRGAVELDRTAVMRKAEAIPLPLGKGISEYRNGNVLVRRIFFIPIAGKIEF